MSLNRSPRRGEVVRVRLDPAEGSEQACSRPALVISPDFINEHSPVVLIAAIISKKTDRIYPFEALITPPEGGLQEPSKVFSCSSAPWTSAASRPSSAPQDPPPWPASKKPSRSRRD